MFKKKSVVNKHVIDMQMDSTTPPDSVFHLFVLLCTLDRFLSVCSCTNSLLQIEQNIIYIYIHIFIYLFCDCFIHAYTILHGLRPISYDVPT